MHKNNRARLVKYVPMSTETALVAASGEPLGYWEGVLTNEGVKTGDNREFDLNSLVWDAEAPAGMPLRWAPEDHGGHGGARHVGWIGEAKRVLTGDNTSEIQARGPYFDAEFGDYLKRAGKVGLSVDCDDESYEIIAPADGAALDPDHELTPGESFEPAEPLQLFSSARIRGVTAVDIPAFITGYIEPVAGEGDTTPVEPSAPAESVVAATEGDGAGTESPAPSPTHAGVLLKADDTNRWLMLQRALSEGDENGGLWEFPGGGIEEGEAPYDGALREFAEEVGVRLPTVSRLLGTVDSPDGVYQLHVMATPSEGDVAIDDNVVPNPDDPDGDQTEAVAWWDPEHVTVGGYHIRPEVQMTDWTAVEAALNEEAPVAETEASVEFKKDAGGHGSNKRTGPGSPSQVAYNGAERHAKSASASAGKATTSANAALDKVKTTKGKLPSGSDARTAKEATHHAIVENNRAARAHGSAAKRAQENGDPKAHDTHRREQERHISAAGDLKSKARQKGLSVTLSVLKFSLNNPEVIAMTEFAPGDVVPATPAPDQPDAPTPSLSDADRTFIQSLADDNTAALGKMSDYLKANPDSELAEWLAEEIEDTQSDIDELDDLLTPDTDNLEPDAEDNLIASAAPVAPPDEWFDPIALDGPTPLTVTAEGRIFGHLATWASCHRSEKFSRRGECVQPPSDPDPEMFHLGQVLTASGKTIDVGRLTVGGGHADVRGNLAAALEHYDDASSVVAAVRVHEDAHGIGLFGSVVPEATPEQIAALRRSPLSGDWRKERGKYRLVAAHAVVVPGYPVARKSGYALVASVSPETFITRGRVEACSECGEDKPVSLVASAFREQVREDFAAAREEFRSALTASLREARIEAQRTALEEMRALVADAATDPSAVPVEPTPEEAAFLDAAANFLASNPDAPWADEVAKIVSEATPPVSAPTNA